MEAKLVETLPAGDGWQFEPKWNGFRCLVVRDGTNSCAAAGQGARAAARRLMHGPTRAHF